MLKFAENKPDVMRCFPDEKEICKLPRQYIANVIYTCCGHPFYKWVEDRINLRNQKLKEENDLLIAMDPEVARIFKQSTSVSGKYLLIIVIDDSFDVLS